MKLEKLLSEEAEHHDPPERDRDLPPL
jgi:hypothetical protein